MKQVFCIAVILIMTSIYSFGQTREQTKIRYTDLQKSLDDSLRFMQVREKQLNDSVKYYLEKADVYKKRSVKYGDELKSLYTKMLNLVDRQRQEVLKAMGNDKKSTPSSSCSGYEDSLHQTLKLLFEKTKPSGTIDYKGKKYSEYPAIKIKLCYDAERKIYWGILDEFEFASSEDIFDLLCRGKKTDFGTRMEMLLELNEGIKQYLK